MLNRLLSSLRPGPKRPGLGLLGPDVRAPQEQGKGDWGFDKLGLASASISRADLTSLVVSILNQQSTQSCVSNAWEQALRMERKRLGYPVILGSRLFGYSNSRAEHFEEKIDSGTYLRTYAWALKKVGSCPETTWPFDPSKVNVHPPARAYREAWALRGIRGYYKIYETGYARTEAVRAALAAGKAVVFGAAIDEAFLNSSGPSLIKKPTSIFGYHAMCFCAYEPDEQNGDYKYKTVNSWTDQWRNGGFVHLTEEYVQWSELRDLWVVSLV
ncbi:MAG: hypothetical protein WC565_04915 [Parcubacteria group bacterium]